MKKITFILLGLLLIAVCAYAQAPEWQWATQAGGSGGDDEGYSITLDDAGNSYVTGFFCGTATFGSYSITSSGGSDIFVAKMDADGNWLWASQAGGSSSDEGYGITLDDAGNSYMTGYFEDTATFGAYSLTSSGDSDIFVAKIDTDGNWLWASQAGGNSDDEGYGITIDDARNSIVTGYFEGTATFGAYSLTSSGYSDIFIAKMDASGNWQWASQAGSTNDDDQGRGITIDDAGNNYVTGYFCGIAIFGSYSLTSTGESNIFMAKIDANGNWLWANGAGGNTDNYGRSIIVDNAGNSYTIGDFEGTATFGPYTLYSNQCSDIFVSKIDTDGNWLWATQAGGYSYDEGNSIALDDEGNCYVTGCFSETAMFDPYTITSSGNFDIFAAKIDSSGNWLWATHAGGSSSDEGYGITIDDLGNYYVTGVFEGTATFGSYSIYGNGETDIFVAKLGSILSAENEISSTVSNLSNYPNPFNPSGAGRSPTTTISFSLTMEITSLRQGYAGQAEDTELVIYNMKGQKVKQFSIDNCQSVSTGLKFSIQWDGTDENNNPVSSGIYLYKIKSGNFSSTKKMILLR